MIRTAYLFLRRTVPISFQHGCLTHRSRQVEQNDLHIYYLPRYRSARISHPALHSHHHPIDISSNSSRHPTSQRCFPKRKTPRSKYPRDYTLPAGVSLPLLQGARARTPAHKAPQHMHHPPGARKKSCSSSGSLQHPAPLVNNISKADDKAHLCTLDISLVCSSAAEPSCPRAQRGTSSVYLRTVDWLRTGAALLRATCAPAEKE